MCRVLKVSKSGFYGWRDRPPSARARADAMLSEKIARIHADSRETYGATRIHFELRTLGVRCARKRVARLMREAGLSGCGGRRRKARTTLRSRTQRTPPAPDLVKRNFTPEAPDRLWVADITYVRTWEGWLYLSFVLDAYSPEGSLAGPCLTQSEDRAGSRCCEYGDLRSPSIARTDPPLRAWQPVHLRGVWKSSERSWSTALDGLGGRRLGQLDGRELRL